jgi:aarF domain-containing kinase
MTANLKDLIDALPQEAKDEYPNGAEIADEELQKIFTDLARRPLPIGSFHRLWTVGELSTQVTLAYLALWVRQWFSDSTAKKQRLVETNLRVALKLIHSLGYLRGAAAKLGQALGSLPKIIPDEIVQTLDRFHFDAPPMHFSLLREMVSNELGADPEKLFRSFDKEPFAAASIGQVHRARLKSGEVVAVKIQYPGIARTIDSDIRNISGLLFPARLSKDWEYTKAQFEEVHRMLKLEVDYVHEAENMRLAREIFDPADGIVIPRVFEQYSTARVLTMEYLEGSHLREFMARRPGQASRNAFATKIYEAWTRMYRSGMGYADPHSGNYVFMRDGRLGLLDFGCVQRYTPEELELLRTAERLLDEPELLPDVLRRAGMPEKQIANKDCLEVMRKSCEWALEPLRVDGPFEFTADHLKRGLEIFSELTLKRYTQGHPVFVYWNRTIIGIRSLMYQLRAKVEIRAAFGM